MRKSVFGILGLFILALGMQSCGDNVDETFKDYSDEEYAIISKRLNLPSEVFEYSINFNAEIFENHFGEENIHVKRNNHKATLGRVLFYDNKLSINESISCATCHKQELAFADDVAFSEGFDGRLSTRNSLPLGNTVGFETAYGGGFERALFGWDESNEDIASQSKAAIESTIEMGLDMEDLIDRIQKDDIYPILFKKTYGDENIMQHRVLEALEEFVNSIVSDDSKFDKELANNEHGSVPIFFPGYTEVENQGHLLYRQNCSGCHSSDHSFTKVPIANNGLEINYEDKGVGARTLFEFDNGKFKVPFLRNIELTAPYMHDGRFETLREVIDHYSEGLANHPNLHAELRDGPEPLRMNFSEDEKIALEAFLNTLTDKSLMADVRFSDPFK